MSWETHVENKEDLESWVMFQGSSSEHENKHGTLEDVRAAQSDPKGGTQS